MEKRNLIRSAGTVGFFILISRVLGMAREMAMAAFFGSSMIMDAFVWAFRIPNTFRSLFGEGALTSAFVPVFTEELARQERQKVWDFANKMLSFLGVILAAIVFAGIIILSLLRNYWPASERVLMILELSRIMLPYMFFICLAALFAAILNSLHRFFMPAATYAVLNIVMLAALCGCLFLDAQGNARILLVSWSVIVAGVIQWSMQLPLLWRCGFRPKFTIDWRDERVRRVWRLMGAAAIGLGATQINVLLDTLLATIIGPGRASYLYYADRLIYFPLGFLGTALGTVLLPAFSSHVTQSRPDLLRQTFNHSFRQLTFLALPAALGMLVLAKPIIQVIYERGKFTPFSTEMTALALAIYAPGLLVFSLLKVLIPMFYAHQDIRTPMMIGIVCTACGIVLKLIFMWPLQHAGIALATVIVSCAQALTLAVIIHRRYGSPGWGNIFRSVFKMIVAASAMGATAYFGESYCLAFLDRFHLALQITRLIALSSAIGLAILVYTVMAAILRCEELNELWSAVRRKPAGQ